MEQAYKWDVKYQIDGAKEQAALYGKHLVDKRQ